jgi:hypothetical protein
MAAGPSGPQVMSEETTIKVWRFASAPWALRALYRGAEQPEWLMQVPLDLVDDVKDLVSSWQEYSLQRVKIYVGAAAIPDAERAGAGVPPRQRSQRLGQFPR